MKQFIIFTCYFILIAETVQSQGCIMIRNISGFGQYNLTDNAFSTSEWQVNVTSRYFKSWRDFKGTVDQKTPKEDQSIIRSFTTDITATKFLNNGWSMNLSLPFAANSRSANKEHAGAGTSRHTTHSFGIGDIRFSVYKWLLNPSVSQKINVQLGLGIKFPSGNYKYEDYFYKNDTTKILAPVNASIALGDGGTGIITEFNTFYLFNRTISFYGNFYYLVNPRDQNGASTTTWRSPTELEVKTTGDVYSVPDVYSIRAGLYINSRRMSLSVGLRDEGVPFTDLFGGNNGRRRPGYNLSFEPGIIYKMKKASVYMYVPAIVARTVKQDLSDQRATEITGVYRMGSGGSGNYSVFVGALFRL
jgi:hypothetical protein